MRERGGVLAYPSPVAGGIKTMTATVTQVSSDPGGTLSTTDWVDRGTDIFRQLFPPKGYYWDPRSGTYQPVQNPGTFGALPMGVIIVIGIVLIVIARK